jgi:hypothetical protein
MSVVGFFAYGSLASPESIGETIGSVPEPIAVVRLPGWRRRWSVARDNLACEKTFARADDGTLPPFCLGLNLERDEDETEGPNGALYLMRDTDFMRLGIRERRYELVRVAPELHGWPTWGFVAKPEHFAPEPPAGAVILSHYAHTVEAAFAALGPKELEIYRETTGPYPVELVEGRLVAGRIPPGNPRRW